MAAEATHGSMTQRQLNLGDVPSWAPTLRNEGLPPDVIVEKIEGLIDQLLLGDDVLPTRKALADGHEFSPAIRASVVQHDLQILEAPSDLTHRVRTLVGVDVDRVYGRTHGLGDLPNLGEEDVAMGENDEDVLAGLSTSRRVHEWLLNVDVVHVEVTAKHTPQDALEGGQTSAVNGASNEPVHRVRHGSRYAE